MAKQQNLYCLYDSMGRPTKIVITASNLKEANIIYNTDKYKEVRLHNPYGKLKRWYNYGLRGL